MALLSLNQLLRPHLSWWRYKWIRTYMTFVLITLQQVSWGNKKASHHVRHESFEMLDGLLPLVLLPFSVDLFGLFWSGLLHLPLSLSETGLDTSLPLQLSLLLDVHALWRMTHVVCVSLLCDVAIKDYARNQSRESRFVSNNKVIDGLELIHMRTLTIHRYQREKKSKSIRYVSN